MNDAGESDIRHVVSPNAKRRRHPSVSCITDKYELDLQFRPCHREHIASAIFKLWNSHTQDKFGFIPPGDLTLPSIDLQENSQENNNIHVSPFLTRDKPGGTHRRVIIDLSFPRGYSVNAGVQSHTYLDTPFLLTLPTIDNITNKIKQLGKGCHLYKTDLSRAFRHVKLDPRDYNLLGLRFNGLYIDSCLPFGFRHGSALFQCLSDAVCYIIAKKGFSVTNYIDDNWSFSNQ